MKDWTAHTKMTDWAMGPFFSKKIVRIAYHMYSYNAISRRVSVSASHCAPKSCQFKNSEILNMVFETYTFKIKYFETVLSG